METKAFWKSKTLQGLFAIFIGGLGVTFPKYASLITTVAPAVVSLISQTVQVFGLIWAAVGRIKTDGVKIGLVSKPAD